MGRVVRYLLFWGLAFLVPAFTTDKLLLASTAGRFYTLAADRLPGGRGFGEPVKAMVDIEGEGNVAALLPASAAAKLLLATSDGRGFVTPTAGAIAETRRESAVSTIQGRGWLATATVADSASGTMSSARRYAAIVFFDRPRSRPMNRSWYSRRAASGEVRLARWAMPPTASPSRVPSPDNPASSSRSLFCGGALRIWASMR